MPNDPVTNAKGQTEKHPWEAAERHRPINSHIQGERYQGGALIDYLIWVDDNIIVFLDENRGLWYDFECADVPEGFEHIRTRITVLTAIDTSHLKRETITSFRELLGNAVVCAVSEKNMEAANTSLDKADEFIKARNGEAARFWYVTSSFAVTLVVLVLAGIIAVTQKYLDEWFGPGFKECALGACAGGLGAFLSVLLRIGQSPLDVSAGRKMHFLEGAGRVVVGMIGAFFVLLAYQLNLVFTAIAAVESMRIYGIGLIGIVAGVSERLVPDLIRQVELTADRKSSG
jgi:hypothetical protein